ncbi:hypothetical protein JHK87_057336 [Glycine soja]|nr:hypothetical protein JHK87_057336 [Glycine soja]
MHCSDQKKSQANKPKKLTIAEALDLQSDLLHPDTNANTRPKRATKRQASLFSCSSSAHDLRHLELEKEKENIASPRGVLEACMKDFDSHDQSHESKATCSTTRARSHWSKFFKIWRKKSFKRLGSLPPLISVPKIPKWKSKSSRENQVLSKLYNFRSSWVTFSLSELRNATNNFSDENIIGRGGFAEVYKGCLQDGQLIAVKKLSKGTTDEKTAGFLCELGVIAHVDHPNTAKLVGCCVEGEMQLVFELSTLGSLGSLLHGLYFAPEYFMHGIVDEKTDVFSFGVLLLEIITGRPAVDHMQQSVVIWVVTLLRGEDHVLKATKSSRRRPLQRAYSEELLDAQEYNSTKHLRDLKRFEQIALG